MPKSDDKVVFDFDGFKKFAASKSGEYDYDDIELCAIGQYITHLLGPKHDRYFMRVAPSGNVYLRGIGKFDGESYTISYPWQLDRVVNKEPTTWENLVQELDKIRPEVFA